MLDKIKIGETTLQELNTAVEMVDQTKLVKIINWLIEADKITVEGNQVRLKN